MAQHRGDTEWLHPAGVTILAVPAVGRMTFAPLEEFSPATGCRRVLGCGIREENTKWPSDSLATSACSCSRSG